MYGNFSLEYSICFLYSEHVTFAMNRKEMENNMDYSHRKAQRRIRFVDASGNPIKNSRVNIQQTNHIYKIEILHFLLACRNKSLNFAHK